MKLYLKPLADCRLCDHDGVNLFHKIPYRAKMNRWQSALTLTTLLVALLTACGGGRYSSEDVTSSSTSSVSATSTEFSNVDYFDITSDQYTLLKPNFYYSTNNYAFWSIQAAIAKDEWDVDWQTVARIDIPKADGDVLPQLDTSFSIEENGPYDKFPGDMLVFNGKKSTYNKVKQGVIAFTRNSDAATEVQGTFDILLTDYDATITPAPQYRLTGAFHFIMGTYGTEYRSTASFVR